MGKYILKKYENLNGIEYYLHILNGTLGSIDNFVVTKYDNGTYSYYKSLSNIESDWTNKATLDYSKKVSLDGFLSFEK